MAQGLKLAQPVALSGHTLEPYYHPELKSSPIHDPMWALGCSERLGR
jgi:hypothetical protein